MGGAIKGPRRQQCADELISAVREPFSSLVDDFLDTPQDGVAIHHRGPRVIKDPLLADHTLGVDEKERPDRGHRLLVEYSVGPDDLSFLKVAQQRVRQLQRFGEGLLRKRIVGADGENLDTQGFEALVVGLPGRQVRRSGRNKSPSVELKEDPLLASEVI